MRDSARSLDCAVRRRTAPGRGQRRGVPCDRRMTALCRRWRSSSRAWGARRPRQRRARHRRAPQAQRPRAEADPAPAPVVPAGPVRRLFRGARTRATTPRKASTSRSSRVRSRSCRRRSSPVARPSSASAGCRRCSPRARAAPTASSSPRSSSDRPRSRSSFKDNGITKPEDLEGQEGRHRGDSATRPSSTPACARPASTRTTPPT